MRIIGNKGEQIGIVPIDKALELAKSENLDLLLISNQSNPPVCKIVDFGQFKYEQQKKEKRSKKNSKVQVTKELKLSPKISSNDYNVRLTNGIKFLKKGYNIKVLVFFKGREMTHPEIGKDLLKRFKDDIIQFGDEITKVTFAHRSMYMILGPK